MAFKPDNYSSVSPYLIVNGAQTTINSLVAVFDTAPLRSFPNLIRVEPQLQIVRTANNGKGLRCSLGHRESEGDQKCHEPHRA